MVIVGVDPGLCGAFVFLDPGGMRVWAIVDMPTLVVGKGRRGKKREISARTLVVEIENALRDQQVALAVVERVTSSPQMGVTSAFSFGRGLGVVDGVIAALGWPVEYAAPQMWKKTVGVRVGAGKDDSRAKACQLLPADAALWTPRRGQINAIQAAGRADAALLAVYAGRLLQPSAAIPGKAAAVLAGEGAVADGQFEGAQRRQHEYCSAETAIDRFHRALPDICYY
jgi:crossover junction endodeoxyribonuclease RuvC